MRKIWVYLVILMGAAAVIVQAQQVTSVTINAANCDHVVVSYNIAGGDGESDSQIEGVSIHVFNDAGSLIGAAPGPAQTGMNTFTVSFEPQPAGTPIRVSVQTVYAEASAGPVPCQSASANPIPPVNSSGEQPPISEAAPPAVPQAVWNGYSDNRLNPDPGEYYSIYCMHHEIRIHVDQPQPALLKRVLLRDVIDMSVPGERDLGDNMTLVRNNEDTVTIYGSNGNLAPAYGEKAFSLNDCIAQNGGEPPEYAMNISGVGIPAFLFVNGVGLFYEPGDAINLSVTLHGGTGETYTLTVASSSNIAVLDTLSATTFDQGSITVRGYVAAYGGSSVTFTATSPSGDSASSTVQIISAEPNTPSLPDFAEAENVFQYWFLVFVTMAEEGACMGGPAIMFVGLGAMVSRWRRHLSRK